ncbi:MAG: galactokinase [Candidatus Niyogibacteria bacterium]|nr:galactokinase [Candidatus Niyogibacteria bacterium]
MNSPIILSRTPFRISLGGGSTDMPSYYQKYGGFIFAATINMYVDIFIKKPVSDDYVHMHYTQYEYESSAGSLKHILGKEALKMMGIQNKIAVSFKADTPAGTGLGSSGACSVGLLKGLSLYKGAEMNNLEAAEQSFLMTQNLDLPDGKQDPYVCALGGFVVLDIDKDGKVSVSRPVIAPETIDTFLLNTLFYYTGIRRNSKSLLDAQDHQRVLELKHKTKKIGQEILGAFTRGDLDTFGALMDEHWNIKKEMSVNMTNAWLDDVYASAKRAGALGGKIMGAGGGGYFMFYCRSESDKRSVQSALKNFDLREMNLQIDEMGARATVINL